MRFGLKSKSILLLDLVGSDLLKIDAYNSKLFLLYV